MATMHDVARRAGVSVATVSFVLNNSKSLSAATRTRVENAIEELGYRRNPVGAALARGKTKIIGLLYPALERPLSGTAVQFITAATERAKARGYNLVIWPVRNDGLEAAAIASTGLVDGLLLMEVEMSDERIPALTKGTTPFALIGRPADPSGMTYVDVDFESSIDEAFRILNGKGHTSFALVIDGWGSSGTNTHGAVVRSRERFLNTAARTGTLGQVFYCREDSVEGRKFGRMIVREYPDITALLLMTERAASGILMGIRDCGKDVPSDISIISIGSSKHMAATTDPDLTFMRSPAQELGHLGVDSIIDRIEKPDAAPPAVLIPCDFHKGSSIAPAP